MLDPHNVVRFAAHWIDPHPSVATVVDRYWHVRWALPSDEVIVQRIIDLPAVTLSIEDGAVPAPLVVTGVQSRAWLRRIHGTGSVFALRLRPAGLAVLGDLRVDDIADATVPLERMLDPALRDLLAAVASATTPGGRARAADRLVSERLAIRPATTEGLLANAIFDELTARVRSQTGPDLAALFGVSARTVQRTLKTTVGRGPKWISRRIRLQEAARALTTTSDRDLAALAVDLGYTDQAHLINDFRGVAGVSPGAYVRSLRALGGA
ncbi:AraC family transcriptional regulator [Leifsonia sp. Leaf325]|nr:AraC family transcriptional regulator [Leifsonia sp. Leaf325]